MNTLAERPAIILLEDGKVFHGKAAGKVGTATGEICFNTGMTGYQELFTDPSYYGQIMVTTNVHIGNYGVKLDESQSGSIKIAALVCRNFTNQYSRRVADESIQDFLVQNNLVAVTGVDTRSLVMYIRDKGAMNAIVSSEEMDIEKLKAQLDELPSMRGLELSSQVTIPAPVEMGDPNASIKIAVLDLGIKKNILDNMMKRGAYLRVFPAKTKIADIRAWNPDAYFVSNGPGDPAAMPYAVETTAEMLKDNKPFFGICLGHQILAQTLGIGTYKMHNGHRGLNHPVKNLITGHCEITSQNHGFAVRAEDVCKNPDVEITHINLNDDTVEGMRHKTLKAFSVQYHPEASPGPHDASYLFDDFFQMIKEK
jgi:carbamoyl-phosphate synthase small subunit